MPPKPEILTSFDNGAFKIRMVGRATFIVASGLQELVKSLNKNDLKSIDIDLEDCTGMDSTFMGILTQLALMGLQIGIRPIVINAGDTNTALLAGLGVKKLFDFKIIEKNNFPPMQDVATEANNMRTQAEMVLTAHETLIKADSENEKKFGAVIDMIKNELDSEIKS